MATLQATNILTGTTEGAKWLPDGDVTELWTLTTTTALALNDIISCMTLPANTYLNAVQVGFTDVDSAASFAWTCGYSGNTAGFITSNTTGQAAGIAAMNVPTSLGYTATTDTVVLVTITATAGTPVAGTFRIRISYTASP